MIDEEQLRESLLRAAAEREPDSAYGDHLRAVLEGHLSLRAFAAAEGIADQLGEGLEAALARYAEQGEQDIEAVRRAFDPDAQADAEGSPRD